VPLTFKAAVLDQAGKAQPYADSRPLEVREIAVEGPRAHEVLVRIAAASLCRSDLSVVEGSRAWPLPIVPGHEASGIIEEVGADVTTVRKGDAVVLVFQPQCGICPSCVAGDAHLCAPGLAANRLGELLGGGTRLNADGVDIHHHMGLSAFAEYAVVSEKSVVAMPGDIDLEVGALFGCAVMCGAGTVLNTAKVQPGDTVAIVGAGGVGSSAILGARVAEAGRIIAIDTDARRLASAAELGASDTILNDGNETAQQVLDMTGGGVDHAFETAGTRDAFALAYYAARRGGQVVTLGLVDPATPFSLDIAGLVTSAKTIKGSYIGSCNAALDIPKYMALYQRGALPVDKLISHRLELGEINTALDNMVANHALRQIIRP